MSHFFMWSSANQCRGGRGQKKPAKRIALNTVCRAGASLDNCTLRMVVCSSGHVTILLETPGLPNSCTNSTMLSGMSAGPSQATSWLCLVETTT
ncbi:hypothetical protein Q7C36_020837 [Tachysurus vachellii]|uniref:Uncharacterized protein n=1 Tax=Tachysurus vachellii TaxID=175792 RepID=A0AA88IVR5_TACVA|nr:hypothetical protein Q7C36_020837 [Tachysurus vachellii]